MELDKGFNNINNKENNLCHIISNGSYLSAICGALKIPHWNFIPIINKLNDYREITKKDLINIINNHHKKLLNNPNIEIDNMLSIMLKENMTLNEMTDHFDTILGAGQDTTSYLMSYMAYLLTNHQCIQDKVREEFNSQKDIDCNDLPYFDMVIKETLRLYSVIPQVTRTCNRDICIEEKIKS